MIWLTWRQHRIHALFAVLGLAAIAALIVPTGLRMHDLFQSSGLADCLERTSHAEFVGFSTTGDSPDCGPMAHDFEARFGYLQPLSILFVFLPLLVGLFFGAPLIARELEHGTHRLVWTQGVSRLRWALVKVGLLGAGTLALAAGYAALLTWWIRPLNGAVGNRFETALFDLQGVAPVGYTLFAVALGVFAGTVTRKVMPAMAVTLVGFIAVRLLVTGFARPNYLPPRRRTYSVVTEVVPNQFRGDWLMDSSVHKASGEVLTADGARHCPASMPRPPGGVECDESMYNLQLFQPAERFWPFQWIETSLYVAVAVLLLALTVHRVRRRLA